MHTLYNDVMKSRSAYETIPSLYVPSVKQLKSCDRKVEMYNNIAFALLDCRRRGENVAMIEIPQDFGGEAAQILKMAGYIVYTRSGIDLRDESEYLHVEW